MRTVLLQSYRTANQPAWVSTCLDSARNLAHRNGWDYAFQGDELFDLVPDHLRTKFASQKPLLSDIAQLAWAKGIFEESANYDRVIWLDADVIVFDSAATARAIENDPTIDFAVGRQIWVQPDGQGRLKSYRQVHNAILMFQRSSSALSFLLDSALALAERHEGPAAPQLLGPKVLTALHNILGFPMIYAVGMASPRVLQDLAHGGGDALLQLLNDSPEPLGALNLCTSYRGQTIDDVTCSDELFERAITGLQSKGLQQENRLGDG